MTVYEILLLAVALSMDAFAVGLTNGMSEPFMSVKKMGLIALFYGAFQFLMPVVGYYGGSVFTAVVEKIAPYLSFVFLAFIGGKMVFDGIMEGRESVSLAGVKLIKRHKLGIFRLCGQAVATSIDALAVGVSLLAQETMAPLPYPAVICALMIGTVTFLLSVIAVSLGKTAGNKLADKAETAGGVILIAIGLKFLLEGIL